MATRLRIGSVIGSFLLLSIFAPAGFSAPMIPAKPPAPAPLPPPTITYLDQDGKTQVPLDLAKVDIHTVINGYVAQTTELLTVRNNLNRVIEGELNFPLPQGAAISGFGLDVDGVVVDGVPVPKEEARITFETEERKGVDPGLAEQTVGNSFRTRIYPINAGGTRTIKVQYVADLADISASDGAFAYRLPLRWDKPIGEFDLHLDIMGVPSAPEVRGAIPGLDVVQQGDHYTADLSEKAVKFDADLLVALPQVPNQSATVEKRTKTNPTIDLLEKHLTDPDAAGNLDTPEYYFAIHDQTAVLGIPTSQPAAPRAVKRLGVCWDVSLNRAKTDKSRQLAVLKKLLEDARPLAVDLIPFSNTVQPTQTFTPDKALADNGDYAKLFDAIDKLTYDGGLNLSNLHLGVSPNTPAGAAQAPAADFYLLFSNGLANLGQPMPSILTVPVFPITDEPQADYATLNRIAAESGGTCFNLLRAGTDDVAGAIAWNNSPSLISVETREGQVADLYPRGRQISTGQMVITGRLLSPQATLVLHYGRGKFETQTVTYTLKQDGATETGIIPRLWAEMKLADLELNPDANSKAITDLGQQFNLVTPNTSLLVLERLQQYLQYQIVPPTSRPEIYHPFVAQMQQLAAAKKQTQQDRIDQTIQLYNDRLKWWQTTFNYDKNFKYTVPAQGGSAAVVNGVTGRLAPAPAPAPAPVAPGQIEDFNDHSITTNGTAANQPADGAAASPAAAPAPAPPTAGDVPQNARQGQQETGQNAESARRGGGRGGRAAGGAGGGGAGGGGAGGAPGAAAGGGGFDGRAADAITESVLLPTADADRTPVTGPSITIKPWDPNTPYLHAMKAVDADKAYGVYLQQRDTFGTAPAFFLDCADYLLTHDQKELGIRVLTDIPALKLESPELLRIAAYRFRQIGEYDLAIDLFEKVLAMRPEEPQSDRDLALALADRAQAEMTASFGPIQHATNPQKTELENKSADDFERSLDLLNQVVLHQPDQRFPGLEVIAMEEANEIYAQSEPLRKIHPFDNPIDPQLQKLMDLDVRVVMSWDTDGTDIDLWVTEPTGELCMYNHNRTVIGGMLSNDITQGYGPEEYNLRHAMTGQYKIQANFYGSHAQMLNGPTTIHVTVFTHWGKPDEKRQFLTLRLTDQKETVDIGTITVEP